MSVYIISMMETYATIWEFLFYIPILKIWRLNIILLKEISPSVGQYKISSHAKSKRILNYGPTI